MSYTDAVLAFPFIYWYNGAVAKFASRSVYADFAAAFFSLDRLNAKER